jgi:hypothetical protein
MGDESDKPGPPAEQTYVLAERDYADIAHLENPSVIERILSKSRTEATAYVSALLQSGLPRYVLAGPKVAFTALAIEALRDLGKEVSAWRKAGKIPEDFSGRASGHQTWVELLVEIDSNPIDADRLKAMKAMFLAANRINATDGESILAYQLFGIAKKLASGELLLLKVMYEMHKSGGWRRDYQSANANNWRSMMAQKAGHGLSALVEQNERALAEHGLITPIIMSGNLQQIREDNARLSDLGIRFCENIQTYEVAVESLRSDTNQSK